MEKWMTFRLKQKSPYIALFSLSFALSGCYSLSRMKDIGDVPALTRTQDPTGYKGYKPLEMPMPTAFVSEKYKANSLWRTGARAFFKDQRASRVGDILTVSVNMNDKANLTNTGTLNRNSTYNANMTNLLGLEKMLDGIMDPTSVVSAGSKPSQTTTGTINRTENVTFKVAAIVTQVLPNGNLVISGRQEFRFNFEVREILVTGVVRPEDILADNTISLEKIGEARLAYGGRGSITDMHQVPPGQQVLTQIMPF